jgi:uncharacterized protein
MHVVRSLSSCLFLGLLASACGFPKANDVRPTGVNGLVDPSAAGDSNAVTVGNGEPLVVDWSPTARANMEVAMHDGIAVVSFRPTGMKLLTNCHVEGRYGYVATTTKEQVVRLESADEVKANLPLGGLGIAAKIGGEFQQGAVVDVALMMVGKFRTTRRNAHKGELVGDCAEATHMVRGAIVGAFVLEKGTKMQAKAAAELFGIGAGGGTSNKSNFMLKDGSVADCKNSKLEANAPPGQCAALVRLELADLTEAAKPAAASAGNLPDAETTSSCPSGMVMVEGKCAQAGSVKSYVCSGETASECATQCNGGNMKSCTSLAQMGLFGARGARKAVKDSAKLLGKACVEGKEPRACAVLGSVFTDPQFTNEPDFPFAIKLFTASCDAGDEIGCMNLAQAHLFARGTTRDPFTAAKYYAKACQGGNKDGCSAVGVLLQGGNGVEKDLPKSLEFLKMSCIGDSAEGCENLGYMVEVGLGTNANPKLAADIYGKACSLSDNHCGGLATAKQTGAGTPKNDAEAVVLYRKACATDDVSACAFLRAYVDPSVKFNETSAKDQIPIWKGLCKSGNTRSCTSLAVLLVALGDKDGGTWMNDACNMGDAWACSNKNLQVKAR